MGIVLGPVAAKFLDPSRWGSAVKVDQEAITLVYSLLSATFYDHLYSSQLVLGSMPRRYWRPARHRWLPTPSQVPAYPMEGDVHLLDPQHDIDVANDIGLCHGRNPKPILRSSLWTLI